MNLPALALLTCAFGQHRRVAVLPMVWQGPGRTTISGPEQPQPVNGDIDQMAAVRKAVEAELAKKFEVVPDAAIDDAVTSLGVDPSVKTYCNGSVLLALKEKLRVDVLIAPTLVEDHWFYNEEFVEDQQVTDGEGNVTSEPFFAYHCGHEVTIATMVAGVGGFYSQYFWNSAIDDKLRAQTTDKDRALLGRNVTAKALKLWSKPKKSAG